MAEINERQCSICKNVYTKSKLGPHIRSVHKGMDQCWECGDAIVKSQLEACRFDRRCRYRLCGNPTGAKDGDHDFCTQEKHAEWCRKHGFQAFKKDLEAFSQKLKELRKHKKIPKSLVAVAQQLKKAESKLSR